MERLIDIDEDPTDIKKKTPKEISLSFADMCCSITENKPTTTTTTTMMTDGVSRTKEVLNYLDKSQAKHQKLLNDVSKVRHFNFQQMYTSSYF